MKKRPEMAYLEKKKSHNEYTLDLSYPANFSLKIPEEIWENVNLTVFIMSLWP